MKRLTVLLAALVAVVPTVFGQASWLGRWDGSMELSTGSAPVSLSIVPDGALLDLPEAELFGYPSASANIAGDSMRLSFAFGSGALVISGALSGDRIVGTYRQGTGEGAPGGALVLDRSRGEADEAFSFAGPDGAILAGSLAAPVSTSGASAGSLKPPLVVMHAGLGAADRDGNNYNVPGRNDAQRQLAQALAARGIASYRYDKRGSGASSWMVEREEDLSFEAWIRDLESAVSALARTGRYSGIWLMGLNDGAIVAAAAANALAASGTPAAGLVVACASADGPLDAFRKAVARAPVEERAAGEALLGEMLAGRLVGRPAAYYAAAFRPSFQPYLIEAFRRDLESELTAYRGPCLIAQGNMDLQATLADFEALQAAKPDAATIMPRTMNHVLKDVSQDVEENFASFSDPGYPVSAEFVEGLAAFIGSGGR